MSDYVPPPIPDPHRKPQIGRSLDVQAWSNAPEVVRKGAFRLTWFNVAILSLFIYGSLFESYVSATFSFLALCVFAWWFGRQLKRGNRHLWAVQIFVSGVASVALAAAIFALLIQFESSKPGSNPFLLQLIVAFFLAVPLCLHLYTLWHWFKPETKAWFGR